MASSGDLTILGPNQTLPVPHNRVPKRVIVAVLGMHRSGTSLCSSIIHLLGIDMASEIGASPSNPRGHWERWEIVELHDEILAALNSRWDSLLPLKQGWWRDPAIVPHKKRLKQFCAQLLEEHGGLCGFKDPRTMRLFPLWVEIARELGAELRLVLSVRHPGGAARSLQARDAMSYAEGELLWTTYHLELLRHAAGRSWLVVEYDDWFTSPEHVLERLQAFLPETVPPSPSVLTGCLAEWIDTELRHHMPPRQSAPSFAQWLLRKLQSSSIGEDAGAQTRFELDQVADHYFMLQRILAPLLNGLSEPNSGESYRALWQAAETGRLEGIQRLEAYAASLAPMEIELRHKQNELNEIRTRVQELCAGEDKVRADHALLEQKNLALALERDHLRRTLEAFSNEPETQLRETHAASLAQMEIELQHKQEELNETRAQFQEFRAHEKNTRLELERREMEILKLSEESARTALMQHEQTKKIERLQDELARRSAELQVEINTTETLKQDLARSQEVALSLPALAEQHEVERALFEKRNLTLTIEQAELRRSLDISSSELNRTHQELSAAREGASSHAAAAVENENAVAQLSHLTVKQETELAELRNEIVHAAQLVQQRQEQIDDLQKRLTEMGMLHAEDQNQIGQLEAGVSTITIQKKTQLFL